MLITKITQQILYWLNYIDLLICVSFIHLYILRVARACWCSCVDVHLKRTGTRDHNCVKVVGFDRPWLGESPADFQNFFNCPFNFILNQKILSPLAWKVIEFAKSFSKQESSKPLLLLDNRFLRAAPRAFESQPEPTQQFWNPPRVFPIKQFSFEKRAAQHQPLLKAGQGLSCWCSKAFC